MYNISIITVNLNNRAGLCKTIESVIRQSYQNKEYIIIDGGSSDGSIDVLEKNYNRIDYWLSEIDLGIYDAMNKGINLAKGEWIIFMNSGDIFKDNYILETVFKNKMFDNTDVIYGNTVNKRSGEIIIAPYRIKKSYFFLNTLCHQSIFTNCKSFNKIGRYNLQYNFIADREWLIRAITSNLNFQYVNEIISEWDPDGFCKSNPQLVLSEIIKMQKTYFKIVEVLVLTLLNKVAKVLRRLLRNINLLKS